MKMFFSTQAPCVKIIQKLCELNLTIINLTIIYHKQVHYIDNLNYFIIFLTIINKEIVFFIIFCSTTSNSIEWFKIINHIYNLNGFIIIGRDKSDK
jgi:hypothetical protein